MVWLLRYYFTRFLIGIIKMFYGLYVVSNIINIVHFQIKPNDHSLYANLLIAMPSLLV